MISTAKDGGTITNYSDRFTVTGLTGNTPPQFEKAISGLSSTDVPETQNDLAAAGAAAGAGAGAAVGAAAGAFGTPYAEQEGLTKYAPMQSIPPTKITLKGYTPKYPTSSFKVATEALPAGTIVTTITQSQTFSVQIQENTVSHPTRPSAATANIICRRLRKLGLKTTWPSSSRDGRIEDLCLYRFCFCERFKAFWLKGIFKAQSGGMLTMLLSETNREWSTKGART